jgi:histone deacetylase HOS3
MTEDREPADLGRLPHSFQALLNDDEQINFGPEYQDGSRNDDEKLLISFGGLSLADQDYGLPPPETFEVTTELGKENSSAAQPYNRSVEDRDVQRQAQPQLTPRTPEKQIVSFGTVTPAPIPKSVSEPVTEVRSKEVRGREASHLIKTNEKPVFSLDQTTGPDLKPPTVIKSEKKEDDKAEVADVASAKQTPITPKDKLTGLEFTSAAQTNDSESDSDLSEFYKKFTALTLAVPHRPVKQTLIYLSPLSYKHVFSRPWVNKRYISTIVERPQRLMACSLGIASAMTMLPNHFKLEAVTKRSSLLSPHVTRVHGRLFAEQLYSLCEDSPAKFSQGKLEVPEDWNYGDIYLAKESISALEGVVGSLEEAVDTLFKRQDHDQVFLTIRPPGHHCHPCVPSGFCLINNVHIAIQYSKEQYGVTHACILDFDLHHGDGTQDMCWRLAGYKGEYTKEDPFEYVRQQSGAEEAPKSVYSSPKKSGRKKTSDNNPNNQPAVDPATAPIKLAYLSIHDINSFPTEAGYATEENIKNASLCVDAHGLYLWNVHLEPYTDEADFAKTYDKYYRILFEKASQFLRRAKQQSAIDHTPFKPLIVLSAGFDASEYENQGMQRHGASVPTSFYNRFTRDAVLLANDYSNGKLLSLLEGGYSDAALSTGILGHLTGLVMHPWESSWGSENVAKSFERGCKLKWTAAANVSDGQPQWLNNGIELGRSLWPSDVKAQVAVANSSAATTGRRLVRPAVVDPTTLATPSRVLRDRSKKAFSLG